MQKEEFEYTTGHLLELVKKLKEENQDTELTDSLMLKVESVMLESVCLVFGNKFFVYWIEQCSSYLVVLNDRVKIGIYSMEDTIDLLLGNEQMELRTSSELSRILDIDYSKKEAVSEWNTVIKNLKKELCIIQD